MTPIALVNAMCRFKYGGMGVHTPAATVLLFLVHSLRGEPDDLLSQLLDLRHSQKVLQEILSKKIKEVVKAHPKSLKEACKQCNQKYMKESGWFLTAEFVWRGVNFRGQLSHRVSCHILSVCRV